MRGERGENGILRLSTLLETLNRIGSNQVDEEDCHNGETDNSDSFAESCCVVVCGSVVVVCGSVVVCGACQVLGDCGVAE